MEKELWRNHSVLGQVQQSSPGINEFIILYTFMILLKRKDDKEEKDIIIQFWSRVAKKVCVQFIILWNILPNSMKMMTYRIIRLFVLFAQSLALYLFTDFYFFPFKIRVRCVLSRVFRWNNPTTESPDLRMTEGDFDLFWFNDIFLLFSFFSV